MENSSEQMVRHIERYYITMLFDELIPVLKKEKKHKKQKKNKNTFAQLNRNVND